MAARIDAAFEGIILSSASAFLQSSTSPADAVTGAASSRVAVVAIARMIGIPIKPHLKAGTVVQLRGLLGISLALRPRRRADLDQCGRR